MQAILNLNFLIYLVSILLSELKSIALEGPRKLTFLSDLISLKCLKNSRKISSLSYILVELRIMPQPLTKLYIKNSLKSTHLRKARTSSCSTMYSHCSNASTLSKMTYTLRTWRFWSLEDLCKILSLLITMYRAFIFSLRMAFLFMTMKGTSLIQ